MESQRGWRYDLVGQVSFVESDGHRITSRRDPVGREIARGFGASFSLAQHFTERGQLAIQTLQVGEGGEFSLNLDGYTEPHCVLLDRRYDYRNDGLLTAITEAERGTRRYRLDQRGRVNSVECPDWAEVYDYDPAGNITDSALSAGRPTIEDDCSRDYSGTLLTRAGRARYRYDAQNRLSQQTVTRLSRKPDVWAYDWDSNDRLAAVTTPDGSRWTYRYDAFGRRIAKTHHDADGTIVAEIRFTWDSNQLIEQTTHTGEVITWTYDGDSFTPIAQQYSRTNADQNTVDRRFYAIVTDLVGTPTELIDVDTKTVAGVATSTLWGQTTWIGATTPLRFPGQYLDGETSLHYNRHRYYNPDTARYLTLDPLGLAPSPNPNIYPHNPTGWSDPLGLCPQSIDPSSVRFSQNKVNDAAEIVDSMREHGWAGPPIDVVIAPDGGLTSVDNTRVLAAKMTDTPIQANVHAFDEEISESQSVRFRSKGGTLPSTWGEALMNRIGRQGATFRNAYPYGSPITGWTGN